MVRLTGERVATFRYDRKSSLVSNVCQHENGPLGEAKSWMDVLRGSWFFSAPKRFGLATGTLPEEGLERHSWLQLAATLLKPLSPDQLMETVERVLRAADRASFGRGICFLLLADTFRQSSPYRHWGINE